MKRLAPALLLAAALAAFIPAPARADVYVADTFAGAIYKFTPGSPYTTFNANVNQGVGLALDASGKLYSADYDGSTGVGSVDTYAATGAQTTYATGFQQTLGLAFDAAGNLFLSNVTSRSGTPVGTIFKITPAGVQSAFATGLKRVRGLAFDAAGNLYATELDSGSVFKYTPAGVQSTFATGFNFPTGLAFDATGNLFVCSQGTGVFKITPAGAVSTFTTNVTDPRWLAFDPATGNLYVSDVGDASGNPGQGNVYQFTPAGVRTTVIAGVDAPLGIAVTGQAAVATAPTVTVQGDNPDADAGTRQSGAFTVTLSAPAAADLKIAYTLKGSAVNGVDYQMLKGTVKIKAGKTSKNIAVVPLSAATGGPKKVVKLTLAPGAGYTVGTPGPVKVKISETMVIVLP